MSGIGSVSGNSTSNYAVLRQYLNRSSSSSSTESNSLASTGDSSTDQSSLAQLITELIQPDAAGQQTESLADQIKTAITTAVTKAQESGDTSDLKQVIEDAVDQTLKDNGYDPEELKTELASAMGSRPEMPPPPPPPPPSEGSNTTDSSNDDSTQQLDPWTKRLLADLWSTDSSDSQSQFCGMLFDAQQ